MSDSEFSVASIDSDTNTVHLEDLNSFEDRITDFQDQENSYESSRNDDRRNYNNLIYIPVRYLSKVLKINSRVYNLILNSQVKFPFDTPIGTPNSEEPTLDLMEQLMGNVSWSSNSYLEYTASGTLRNIPIYSGTIHQVSLWASQKMHDSPCLFEITAQVVGIAQKDPSQPNCKGNEINLLVRDVVKRDPVIQVMHPYYLHAQLPQITVGQMVRCVGVMMDTHLMQSLNITIASYVH